jgi:flagellar protein FlbD
MIQLTRLNNHPLVVNSDLIKFVEQAPDTVITLVNGDKIVVRESAQDVLERVVQFRRSVLQGIMLCSDNNGSANNGSALPPALPPALPGNDAGNETRTDAGNDARAVAANGERHGRPAGEK